MKRNRKSVKVMFLGAFIALVVIAIAGMNMRTFINNDGLTGTARRASANDATTGDVLEGYTFTSDTAGIGVAGSITDYSQTLKQIKLLASSANQTVTMDLDDGYYTQIKVDTTDVYNAGYDDGYEDGKLFWSHAFVFCTASKDFPNGIGGGNVYNGMGTSSSLILIRLISSSPMTYELSFKKAGYARVVASVSYQGYAGCGYVTLNGNVILSGSSQGTSIAYGPVTTSDKFRIYATPPSVSNGMQYVRTFRFFPRINF